MCGIAGYVGPAAPEEGRVRRCLARMATRGPDGCGVHRAALPGGRSVVMLHSRLRIVDLDARSDQPLRRGGDALAVNGELYNYVELRARLIAEGETFVTQGDAEVLLAWLRRHGLDGLDACEGMWAFAWLDGRSGRLMLCRDRFGEKPLFVMREGEGLYWGSEVKFIQALAGRRLAPNVDQVCRLLVNGYKCLYQSGETFFQHVEVVPAATAVVVEAGGGERPARYWRPSFVQDDAMTLDEAVNGVRARLVESMRLRLRADVSIAFCLSGGVDSNALAGAARRALGQAVHGFTVASRDARYDEVRAAADSAAGMGARQTSVPIESGDFIARLDRLVRRHDAPVLTISSYVHAQLMGEIAARGFRIAVSGSGADELFTGYYDHHNLFLHDRHGDAAFSGLLSAWQTYVAPLVRSPHLRDPLVYVRNPGSRAAVLDRCDALDGVMATDWQEAFTEVAYCPALLRKRMLNELFHEVVPVLLHEEDHNAMAHAVENRSPYLDRRLAEFAFRIPTRHLIVDAWTKYPLRRAAAEWVGPAVAWNRHKIGFNASVMELLDLGDPAVRAALLDRGAIHDLVRRDRIEGLLKLDPMPNSVSKFLFSYVSSRLFLDAYGGSVSEWDGESGEWVSNGRAARVKVSQA